MRQIELDRLGQDGSSGFPGGVAVEMADEVIVVNAEGGEFQAFNIDGLGVEQHITPW